jgi:hypothetical protein
VAIEHLSDSSTYRPIAHMQARTVEIKMNRTWSTICSRHELKDRVKNSFLVNNSSIPHFYHLIKTHKSIETLKIRPIISNINGPTHKISWLLSFILRPLLNTVSAHLESSDILIQKIRDLDVSTRQEFSYPFSLDVVSLYTSIPPSGWY